MSDITKKYRNKKWICFILSTISWLGLCGFLIIYGLATAFQPHPDTGTIREQLVDIFMPMIITWGLAIGLFIFVKEKMRTTVWICNILLATLLFGVNFTYISIGLFALDEYILTPLCKHYKNKQSINKEIDKRY